MSASDIFAPIIDIYRNALAEHGNSPAAVLWPKGRQDLRFERLTAHIRQSEFSLLDFGCGLGGMCGFLERHFPAAHYHGADFVPEFIDECGRTWPHGQFHLLQHVTSIVDDYDYVALSGVFNILYVENETAHKAIVRDILRHLFGRCKVALSVNFMTDAVDFRQPMAYHQNVMDIYNWVSQELSPRLIIDQSYMPYEYTVTVFRDATIERPANIYSETKI